jgi:hypothetical protein
LKTWSSDPIGDNSLYRKRVPWGTGIMGCWNTGKDEMISVLFR